MRKLLPLLLALCAVGCSRGYYRASADKETYPIVAERQLDPAFAVGRTRLEPAATSRLADPFDPDATPKPPDDPAAAAFMARPNGMRGASHWGKNGYADSIEPPGWEACLGLTPAGTLKLDQQSAVDVALTHSRQYQTELETVYLSALGLTLNRFDFALHWFGRTGPSYTRVGVGDTGTNTLTVASDAGFSKNFAAGGQLLVDFANSFVWEFTGRTSAVTTGFGFTLVQPLLRGFGRQVRLEGLTQAERDTLYAVRDYARFRKAFWAAVAVQNGGYLDLMLQIQAVRNARLNLASQEQNYRLYRELFLGNRKSVVEVDQAFQGLLSARQQILDSEIGLESVLDAYKRRLGLPPRLAVELDDAPLQKFVLVDPPVDALRNELEAFDLARKGELRDPPTAAALRRQFDDLLKYVPRVAKAADAAEADLGRWKRTLDRPADTATDADTRARAADTYAAQRTVPGAVKLTLDEFARRAAEHRDAVADALRPQAQEALSADLKKLTGLLDEVITAQSLARIYAVELPAVDWAEPDALAFAHEHRLDLMNQLARVTDSWRKVIVAANALKSDLSVTIGGTAVTAPDAHQPFDFSRDASRFTAGVQFDGPLNRLAERNAYRASQIAYQQARRAYTDLSDFVEQGVRLDLRSLRQTRVSFEISRQSLIAAARQVENERILLTAPAQKAGGGDDTLRTLRALDQLNAARNSFVANFVRYEQQRVQLLLDLEALQLDDRGFPTNADPSRTDDRPADRPGPGPGPVAPGAAPPRALPVGPGPAAPPRLP